MCYSWYNEVKEKEKTDSCKKKVKKYVYSMWKRCSPMTHFVLAIALFLPPINHPWINLIGWLTVIFACPQSGLEMLTFSSFCVLASQSARGLSGNTEKTSKAFMWSWKQSIGLVPSFKTSKLNQTVFNQGKLKSTSINLQERPRKRFLRVCDIMSAVLTTTS